MSRKEKLKVLERLWYERNPCHDLNSNTGEDMFWSTVLCVFDDLIEEISKKGLTPNCGLPEDYFRKPHFDIEASKLKPVEVKLEGDFWNIKECMANLEDSINKSKDK